MRQRLLLPEAEAAEALPGLAVERVAVSHEPHVSNSRATFNGPDPSKGAYVPYGAYVMPRQTPHQTPPLR